MKKTQSDDEKKEQKKQRTSYNFRPRKQYNTSSCESSKGPSVSSFNPSKNLSYSNDPSLSHNQTYNKAASSCRSSIDKEQSASKSTKFKSNEHLSDLGIQLTKSQPYRVPTTKYTNQHPNDSMCDQ